MEQQKTEHEQRRRDLIERRQNTGLLGEICCNIEGIGKVLSEVCIARLEPLLKIEIELTCDIACQDAVGIVALHALPVPVIEFFIRRGRFGIYNQPVHLVVKFCEIAVIGVILKAAVVALPAFVADCDNCRCDVRLLIEAAERVIQTAVILDDIRFVLDDDTGIIFLETLGNRSNQQAADRNQERQIHEAEQKTRRAENLALAAGIEIMIATVTVVAVTACAGIRLPADARSGRTAPARAAVMTAAAVASAAVAASSG